MASGILSIGLHTLGHPGLAEAMGVFAVTVWVALLAASLLLYRPFCQFVCPAGLLNWIFEHPSLFAVRKNEKRCTNCRQCIKAGPCNAIEAIVDSRQIVPDCFACGACITSCPEDALTFSLK